MTEDLAIDPPVGQISGYKIGTPIAEGGYGVVYHAHSIATSKREKAVKILQSLPFEDLPDNSRFLREVDALYRLTHRGIVSYDSAGHTSENLPYLMMEYVEGETLARASQSLPLLDRVQAMLEVLRALDYAHEQGVLHRDIKPANIILRSADGQPVILDFGLAFVLDGLTKETLTEQAPGSMGYIPPEVQADPRHRSRTHDVFACAVTLFEILVGKRPNIQSDQGTLAAQAPELSGLDHIVWTGLAAEPNRYQTCAKMADAIQAWLDRAQAAGAVRQSSLTSKLRIALSQKEQSSRSEIENDRRLSNARDEAFRSTESLVEAAAAAAFSEVASLLSEAKDVDVPVVKMIPSSKKVGATEALLVMSPPDSRGHKVIFARSSTFRGVLGRGQDPLIAWPQRTPTPGQPVRGIPTSFLVPCWVLYDDLGGRRSPSLVIHGGVALSIERIDQATAEHKLAIHARPPSFAGQVRDLEDYQGLLDYWVECLASVFNIRL